MKFLIKARDTIYNKVWHGPKGKLNAFLKTKCADMPHGRRMKLVAVLFTVFVVIAFLLFGTPAITSASAKPSSALRR